MTPPSTAPPRKTPRRKAAPKAALSSFKKERLPERHLWWRVARQNWKDPLDPDFARRRGGRWNPPGTFPVLYFNEDFETARLNLQGFVAAMPYVPEDLREDNGPVLVGVRLPARQTVCDAHTDEGLRAARLPKTYPRDADGKIIEHERCQTVGVYVRALDLNGVRARSARMRERMCRELAWFPTSQRHAARRVHTLPFHIWYWNDGAGWQSG